MTKILGQNIKNPTKKRLGKLFYLKQGGEMGLGALFLCKLRPQRCSAASCVEECGHHCKEALRKFS